MLKPLDKGRPVCPQIYEQLCLMIASGELSPNERLSSVREMAVQLGVNPNTVQRAFELLAQDSVLYSVLGSGWYVCEDTTKAKEVLQEIVDTAVSEFFSKMDSLGISAEGAKKIVEEWNNG